MYWLLNKKDSKKMVVNDGKVMTRRYEEFTHLFALVQMCLLFFFASLS